MKLISWKRFRDHTSCLAYELTVEVTIHYSTRGLLREPEVRTKTYRGDMYGWANRETGYEAGSDSARDLAAILRKIEWGDYPDLEVK